MRLSTSRVLSTDSNRGCSTPAPPTRASTAVPPRAGFGTVATGWHPARARATAAPAAVNSRLLEMGSHPDEGQRADEEGGAEHPRRPVDLALEPAAGAIPAAAPIAATTNRSAEARGLWRLDEDARHQEDRKNGLRDDERLLDLSHWTRRFYLRARPKPTQSAR